MRPGFSRIRLRVRLDGPEERSRYEALAAAVDRHCPVLDILENQVPVTRELRQPAAGGG